MYLGWTSLLIATAFMACSPATDLDDYGARMANVLEQPLDVVVQNQAQFPRARELHLEIPAIRVGMLDFLQLHRCDLGALIGMRNSPLGKVMTAYERFRFEVVSTSQLERCLEVGLTANDELLAQWHSWLRDKQHHLPLAYWNYTLGGPELADYFGSAPLPFEPSWDAAARQFDRLSDQGRWDEFDEPVVLGALQNLNGRAGEGGELLREARRSIAYLDGVTRMMDDRLRQRAVCLQQRPSPRGRALHRLLIEYFGGRVQPRLALLHRSLTVTSESMARLVAAQRVPIPAAFAGWYGEQFASPRGALPDLTRAIAEHVNAWQRVLRQCGMAVDANFSAVPSSNAAGP